MNKMLKLATAGLATAALAALAVVAPTAAYAAADTPPVVGSGAGQTDEALYVLDPELGTPLAAGSSVPYSLSILGGPSATDPLAEFSAPAGGTQWAYTFISQRGKERDYNSWSAMSSLGPGTEQSLVQINPSGQATTGPGQPAGTAAVASAGGDYSLGVAWVTNNIVVKTAFTYITVVPGNIATTTITFAQPVTAPVTVAPAITTQPTGKDVLVGQTATFSAAASGTPTPTVQWQSSTDGTTWANISGATSASYTTPTLAVGDNGKKFRAVFTNSAGTATTNAAALTVTDTTPTQPNATDNASTKITVADPAEGAKSVTAAVGTTYAGQTLQAWGWSDPTNLGTATVDPSGNVVINIAGLPAGTHTIAVTLPNSSTVIAWFTITIPALSYGPQTDTVGLKANVTASDLWKMEADYVEVDFGNVTRGASVNRDLGKVTVVDDRNVLKGWTLTAAWPQFTSGANVIPASAMTYTPKAFGTTALPTGITAGATGSTTGSTFAQSAANVSTGVAGVPFDAAMTFTAPGNANSGLYTSTLTLTLTSK